jgi:hypothetical protein
MRWYTMDPPAAPENPNPGLQRRIDRICHCFIRDGQIQFLLDCTHALAGQTVPLPPIDD